MSNTKIRHKKKEHKFIKIVFLIIFITIIYLFSPKLLNIENTDFAYLAEPTKEENELILSNSERVLSSDYKVEAESVKKESELILVNFKNKLPDDYKVELINFKNYLVANTLLNDLETMYSDAKKRNITLYINNAYRSIEEQQKIFNDRVQKYKEMGYNNSQSVALTKKEVQEPGYSEHHTGLAIDFSKDYTVNEQMWMWLEKNAYKYGFILRYPADKVQITNIDYEPWHYRYVGKDVAKTMYDNNLCLEEYLDNY